MRLRPARRTHGLAVRLLVGTTAGLAVVASSATGAMAEDVPPTEETGPSTLVLEPAEPTGADDAGTESDAPLADPDAPDAGADAPESVAPDSEAGESEVAETEADGDAAEVAPPAGPADEAAQPLAIAPSFGNQKVRIGVQQADGSYLDPEATLVGTTMSITITGGVDGEGEPLATETTSCVVSDEFGDDSSRSADCEVVGGDYELDLDAGRTATITPTVVPAGIVLAPASQVVQPCLILECVPFPGALDVEFSATGTPVAVSAATTAPQPVTIDVVAPLDLAPDNAVTGVTVTQQSANGTAVVTGDLPPVPDEPIVPVDETALVAAAAPVTAQAPSGTSRIVFTPAAGFAGTTTFGYAVATQNGTITGTATVTVAPAPVVTPPVATPPTSPAGAGIGAANRVRFGSSTGNLPSTGGPAQELLAVGALLVVAGAMAARRRTERDLVG